jgi:hypothetical protein
VDRTSTFHVFQTQPRVEFHFAHFDDTRLLQRFFGLVNLGGRRNIMN